MKKIYCVLIVLLVCSVFTACGREATGAVSAKVLTEMEDAWQKKYGSELPWGGKEGYFGTYKGAVVFGYGDDTGSYSEVTVAGEVFGGVTVAVYKDGEFCGILAAYETGILTEENIKSVAKYYEEYTYAVTNREPNSK